MSTNVRTGAPMLAVPGFRFRAYLRCSVTVHTQPHIHPTPYNYLLFMGEDPRASLVSVCFQVLCVILDFHSRSARDVPISDPLTCQWTTEDVDKQRTW